MKEASIEEESFIRKYLLVFAVILILFLSYMILRPYLIVLVTTFILAYLFRPISVYLTKFVGKTTASFLCLLIVFSIFIIPALIFIGVFSVQAYRLFGDGQLRILLENLSQFPAIAKLHLDLNTIFGYFGDIIIGMVGNAVSYVPSLFISIFIMFFAFYYMIHDWEELSAGIEKIIPLKNKKEFLSDIDNSTRGMIYGTLIIGLIEFLVAWIGFWLLGIQFSIVLGVLIFFTAFIPGVGPSFVWVPTAIYFLFYQEWVTFFGVIVIGLIIGFYVDSILRSKILGEKTNIHPVIMLAGIFGGVSLFGVFGFIIGPLVLQYTLKIIQKVLSSYKQIS